MSEAVSQVTPAAPAVTETASSGARGLLDALAHWTALAGAVLLIVLTAGETQPGGLHHTSPIPFLAVIVAFTVLSDRASVPVTVGDTFWLSGGMLGIALTTVLFGPAPGAVVGGLSILIGWLSVRSELWKLRHNLVNFLWFPLLSGLFFHVTASQADLRDGLAVYYLLVFAAFLVALLSNFAMAASYASFRTRTSFLAKIPQVKPLIIAELSSAMLTLVAVYLVKSLGLWGLLMFGLVLLIFQYLVGELLESVRRGSELRVRATTDDLTGLANRNHFKDTVLRTRIEQATRSGESFAVMLLDLDNFRDVNDTGGHENGDKLLKEIGSRLSESLGEKAVIARFGGDEFAILPECVTGSTEEITAIAEKVVAAIEEPITMELPRGTNGKEAVETEMVETETVGMEIKASIGVVRFPADVPTKGGDEVEELLRRADIAMYEAKDHHDGYQFFHPDQETKTKATQQLLNEFKSALKKDELFLVYHPIIDLEHGRVHGAEALVRWQHDDGLRLPFEFIDVVEQTSLIGDLTATVLDKAVAECARWHAAGMDLSVSVNLSVRNLLDESLPDLVSRTLEKYNVHPEWLKLEITESMIMPDSDEDRTVNVIRELGRLGVKISVDDFGTGYSSLTKLRLLPINQLKIDRSFVSPMLTDTTARVIVKSTIRLAKELGLEVVAEGVETAEILRDLEKMDCDQAQGHYMSTPMPAAEFPEWCKAFEEGYRRAA